MGQDYSYSQPSSTSESVDITSLFEAEAQIYADEADSSYCNAIPVQYPRQPEADDGIPTTCYNASPQLVGTIPRKLRPCKQGPQMAWEPSHGAFGGVKVTGSSVPFPVL
ncbi:hypothetical protein Bca4012_057146 [Brassica carinata]